ncbi:MAG: sensor histidine kinase [Acetobacteraceae bacterium]
MRRISLRLRLLAGGIAAILVALTIAGVALSVLFERHVSRTIAADLDVYLKQLLAATEVDAQGRLLVSQPPADPRFAEPLSGLYWELVSADGQLLRSRSLWDTVLRLPADAIAPGGLHLHEIPGPTRTRVLAAERSVFLTIGGRRERVRVVVATDVARIAAARSAFARDLALALALLGVVLAAATSVQVALGLRPLDGIRRGIAAIRSGDRRRLPAPAPVEVRPLVEEVNALLDAQEQEIERSRGRAADLAHGLKTPLAALASDAGRLREEGAHEIARDIEAIAEAMSRTVDRELARARARASTSRSGRATVALEPLVQSLLGTLARTPSGARIRMETDIPAGASVPFERTDLAEVLGNLLDNAVRHAESRVRVIAFHGENGVSIAVEDDGPGIAPAVRAAVLARGARLDELSEGAGLGLAIVLDVLDAYGWRLVLDTSALGGLKATVAPRRAGPHGDGRLEADANGLELPTRQPHPSAVRDGRVPAGLLERTDRGGNSEPCLSIFPSRMRLTKWSSGCARVRSGTTDPSKVS